MELLKLPINLVSQLLWLIIVRDSVMYHTSNSDDCSKELWLFFAACYVENFALIHYLVCFLCREPHLRPSFTQLMSRLRRLQRLYIEKPNSSNQIIG